MMPVFSPLGEQDVHLTEASGRRVSRDITARFDAPAFDNSAMDGYAVRAGDVASATADAPVRLPVRGESRAGKPLRDAMRRGTACRIFTGAPMPTGADAVVIQEDTDRHGDEVMIKEASPEGRHVRARGSDVSSGSLLLRRGDRLWPGEIGLLAGQNIDRVHVFRQPKVAILSTGDELRQLGDDLEPGMIVNSNIYVLTEMLRGLGAIPIPLPAVPDTLADIDITREPITRRYDCVVMNPPFHAGRKTEPALGEKFIEIAAKALKPKGRLLLVANSALQKNAQY